jgi:hypothetical protein
MFLRLCGKTKGQISLGRAASLVSVTGRGDEVGSYRNVGDHTVAVNNHCCLVVLALNLNRMQMAV